MNVIRLDQAAYDCLGVPSHPSNARVRAAVKDADMVIGPDDTVIKNVHGGTGDGAQIGQLEKATFVGG